MDIDKVVMSDDRQRKAGRDTYHGVTLRSCREHFGCLQPSSSCHGILCCLPKSLIHGTIHHILYSACVRKITVDVAVLPL